MIKLKVLSKDDAEQIRLWRNECLDTLRTPYPLTKEQQTDWYDNTVCDRQSNARWFGVWAWPRFVGYTGIENISFENRTGEISLLIDPSQQHKGYGKQAAELILDYAFNSLNLNCVYGECYNSNPAVKFWTAITEQRDGYTTTLPCRKYVNGEYVSSLYFSIERPL